MEHLTKRLGVLVVAVVIAIGLELVVNVEQVDAGGTCGGSPCVNFFQDSDVYVLTDINRDYVKVGHIFRSSVAGYIYGIRMYLPQASGGQQTTQSMNGRKGEIWRTINNPTAPVQECTFGTQSGGWIYCYLAAPYQLVAGEDYKVVHHSAPTVENNHSFWMHVDVASYLPKTVGNLTFSNSVYGECDAGYGCVPNPYSTNRYFSADVLYSDTLQVAATPSPTPAPISYVGVRLQATGEGTSYPQYVEGLIIGSGPRSWINGLTARSIGKTHGYRVEERVTYQQADNRWYTTAQLQQREGSITATDPIGSYQLVNLPEDIDFQAFVKVTATSYSGAQVGTSPVSYLELSNWPTNITGTAFYDPLGKTCYGTSTDIRGAEWDCQRWVITNATGTSATPTPAPALATPTPIPGQPTATPLAASASTPVIPQGSSPDVAGAINRQTDTQAGWFGYVSAVLGNVAASVTGIPSAMGAEANRLLVPNQTVIDGYQTQVREAFDAKTNAVGRVTEELGNLGAGLMDADCSTFAGITLPWPGILGGGAGGYTVLGELGPFWCPYKPLADALIKLGTGAGFAAALLRRLNNK
jgi:hypothetical protein